MGRALDYEKAKAREAGRTNPYRPERKPKGPSGNQTKYLAALRRKAGVPKGPMPRTAKQTSAEIAQLKRDLKLSQPKTISTRSPSPITQKLSDGTTKVVSQHSISSNYKRSIAKKKRDNKLRLKTGEIPVVPLRASTYKISEKIHKDALAERSRLRQEYLLEKSRKNNR